MTKYTEVQLTYSRGDFKKRNIEFNKKIFKLLKPLVGRHHNKICSSYEVQALLGYKNYIALRYLFCGNTSFTLFEFVQIRDLLLSRSRTEEHKNAVHDLIYEIFGLKQ